MTSGISIPYLCGGTLFTLMEQVKEKDKSKQELWEGERSSTSNKYILGGLLSFLEPSFKVPDKKSTFDTEVSDYKKCEASKGSFLPFNQDNTETLINGFNERMKDAFPKELDKADHFVSRFLKHGSEELMTWFVRALLELLEKDRQLPGEKDLFFSNPDGIPVTRNQLLHQDSYCVSTLLLGIWHYIVINRPDNDSGKPTIAQWCRLGDKSVKGAHLSFVSDIGKTCGREIHVKSRSYDPYFGKDTTDNDPNDRNADELSSMSDGDAPEDEWGSAGSDYHSNRNAMGKESYSTETQDGKTVQKLFINSGSGIQAETINGSITLHIGKKDGK